MKQYFAPMEGITGYVFRNAYEKYFASVDQYYSPFISPTQHKCMNHREKNDILPIHNMGISLIPQVLTNQTKQFLDTATALEDMGYKEINLNLGCPSATVVTKGKGAGFLERKDALHSFLEEVFAKCPINISLKTRLGMSHPEEVWELLTIFQEYPVKEWILHTRVREDFYNGEANMELFGELAEKCKIPLCYNGDIATIEDYNKLHEMFPNLQAVMLGRGLLSNPSLARQIAGGSPVTVGEFRAFQKEICMGYTEIMSGERNTLFKMKELWSYWEKLFFGQEKEIKRVKKASTVTSYLEAVENILPQDDNAYLGTEIIQL